MEIVLDSVLAFLSCVGLWTLGKIFLKHLFIDSEGYADHRVSKEELHQNGRK